MEYVVGKDRKQHSGIEGNCGCHKKRVFPSYGQEVDSTISYLNAK
jgi:hypothetical protein